MMSAKKVSLLVRFILFLLLIAVLPIGFAAAEIRVTLSDLHYGDEANDMFIEEKPNFITFMDHEWSLDEAYAYSGANFFGGVHAHGLGDRATEYRDLPRMLGGKTLSVYEFTVHKDDFTVTPSSDNVHLVTVEFSIPYTTTLYVGVGNRTTGEYVFEDPITLNGTYTEPVYMPRDEKGRPALVDRVYLYSYDYEGQTRYYALTLYIEYDSYPAAYPAYKTEIQKAEPTPVPKEELTEPAKVAESTPAPSESADLQALMLFLENDMPISEDMINRIVESGEMPMEKLLVLFAAYGVEFPIPEPTPEPVRSVSYQAMILYLQQGQNPPKDIIDSAIEADQLTDEDLKALFASYDLVYSQPDSQIEEANEEESDSAATPNSFDHTILASRPGYTFYPDEDFWYFENSYVKTHNDRYIEARIAAGGSGDELSGLPAFYFTYSNTENNTSAADIVEVYVRVDGTTYSLPISASMFNTFGSFLYSKNGKALIYAMADADEIDLAIKTTNGFISETVSGSDYADTLRSAAKGIKNSNMYSVIDPEAEENEIRKALKPVAIVDYDYPTNSFIQRLLDEPGASVIFADEIYWTYGLPYTAVIDENTLICSLTFSGEGDKITSLPALICTLTDKDGHEIGITNISVKVNGETLPVVKSEPAESNQNGKGGLTPPAYLKALADAPSASISLTLWDGSVLEKVILDTDLAATIQDAAIRALEIVY